MSLLFRVVYSAYCRSTHHKLALDALTMLEGDQADAWRNLFLSHYALLLRGSKDPDDTFKDFKNHVVHVALNNRGGAPVEARRWYEAACAALKEKRWPEAVYAAGVLSHYITDPVQPFHTAQSAAEANIHRAAEWSINKSYNTLWQSGAATPDQYKVVIGTGEDWLEQLVIAGRLAHPHYQTLIDHYDFDRGVKSPVAGLDAKSHEILGPLLRYAATAFARVLDRAIEEAQVEPPKVRLALPTGVALMQAPLAIVGSEVLDEEERCQVRASYDELVRTGQVEKHLPEECRIGTESTSKPSKAKAAEDAAEVRTKAAAPPAETKPAASKSVACMDLSPVPKREVSSKPAKFHLTLTNDLEDAPTIGPKTAQLLAKQKLIKVGDFLKADAKQVAAALGLKHITAEDISEWQDQARLVCEIPDLRGHEAQLLVICDYRSAQAVTAADAAKLLKQIDQVAATSEGQRVLRSQKKPDLAEVQEWISNARSVRTARAA